MKLFEINPFDEPKDVPDGEIFAKRIDSLRPILKLYRKRFVYLLSTNVIKSGPDENYSSVSGNYLRTDGKTEQGYLWFISPLAPNKRQMENLVHKYYELYSLINQLDPEK